MGVMVENRTGPNRLVQARARCEQAQTGSCKNRTGSNRLVQESNRHVQARTGEISLVQEPNRWWGSWWENRTGSCKNRTGLNRLVQESNRLERACARSEQGDDKVAVTRGSWGRIVQVRTGSCKNRTVLCKNRTGGGHGGESKVSIYI